MENTNNLPRLLTVPEVAELLHVNINTAHELRKSGLLPMLKFGQYKVRPEALAEMLAKYEGWDITDPYHPQKLEEGGAQA